jgi:hypothetical protein
MPRVETTVINDLIRECGKPNSINLDWKIPIERAGWECSVSICLCWNKFPRGNPDLYIAVHAQGYRTGGTGGHAFYTAISGFASPSRLTRKWIESVLRREIETARAAALSFTEEDLYEDFASRRSEEDLLGMQEYFKSSLHESTDVHPR